MPERGGSSSSQTKRRQHQPQHDNMVMEEPVSCSSDGSSSLNRLAGLALVSRLEDSSYLRTIPEDRGDDDEDPVIAATTLKSLNLADAAKNATRLNDLEYPSSLHSEAASSCRAMVPDDDDEGTADRPRPASSGRTPSGRYASASAAVAAMTKSKSVGSGGGASSQNSTIGGGGNGPANSGEEQPRSTSSSNSKNRRGGGNRARVHHDSGVPSKDHSLSLLSSVCRKIDFKSRKVRAIICLAFTLTVLLVLAVVLVSIFFSSPKYNHHDNSTSADAVPEGASGNSGGGGVTVGEEDATAVPGTVFPSVPASTREQLDAIITTVSDPESFRDPDTPQSMARNWMLNSDYLLYDVLEEGASRTAQRYACAEFIFSLVRHEQQQSSSSSNNNNNRRRLVQQQQQRGQRRQRQFDQQPQQPSGDEAGREERETTTSFLRKRGITHRRNSRALAGGGTGGGGAVANAAAYDRDEHAEQQEEEQHHAADDTLHNEVAQSHDLSYYLLADREECDWPGFECDDGLPGHVVNKISLPANNLVGSLPQEIKSLTYLQELDLSQNTIVGDLPKRWFDGETSTSASTTSTTAQQEGGTRPFQHLYLLDLSHNQLEGPLHSGLWELPVLRFLYLSDNLFDEVLAEPSSTTTTTAENSNAGGQQQEPSPPSSILQYLWLDDNEFRGTFPAWMLRGFAQLESLRIYNNSLTGPLPTDLTPEQYPRNLTYLDASMNLLSGTIPASLFQYPALEYLYLEYNRLSGPLPSTTVENADAATTTTPTSSPLKIVALYDNQLTGPVPSEFGSTWTGLEQLLLHENQLSGEIPPDWGLTWTKIQRLTLQENELTGAITSDQCSTWNDPNLSPIEYLFTDCNIDCPCCTDCYQEDNDGDR